MYLLSLASWRHFVRSCVVVVLVHLRVSGGEGEREFLGGEKGGGGERERERMWRERERERERAFMLFHRWRAQYVNVLLMVGDTVIHLRV